jgi:hypothetical protein
VSLFTTDATIEKFGLQQLNNREKRYAYVQTINFLQGVNDTNSNMHRSRRFGQ